MPKASHSHTEAHGVAAAALEWLTGTLDNDVGKQPTGFGRIGRCSVGGLAFDATNDNVKSRLRAAGRTKINSSDPPLTAVRTAYATPPLLSFFHPPIDLATLRPHRPSRTWTQIDCTSVLHQE